MPASTLVEAKTETKPMDAREAAVARLKAQGAWNSPIDRRRFFSTAAAGWALFAAGFGGLSAIFAAFHAIPHLSLISSVLRSGFQFAFLNTSRT